MPIMLNITFDKIIAWQQVAHTQQETVNACMPSSLAVTSK